MKKFREAFSFYICYRLCRCVRCFYLLDLLSTKAAFRECSESNVDFQCGKLFRRLFCVSRKMHCWHLKSLVVSPEVSVETLFLQWTKIKRLVTLIQDAELITIGRFNSFLPQLTPESQTRKASATGETKFGVGKMQVLQAGHWWPEGAVLGGRADWFSFKHFSWNKS